MRVRIALLVSFAAVLLAGAAGAAGFDRGTATVASPSGAKRVVLQVEIARTRAQREQGLMGRRTLGARAGMVFLYPEPHRGSFWMKDTLIPLDIAFYDGRGRILRILTMQPCRRDPCTLYDPNVAFRGALEVRAGSFRRWGVRAGDRIAVRATRSG